MNTVTAKNVISRKAKGGEFISLDCTCPFCSKEVSVEMYVEADTVKELDDGFEAEIKCEYCGETITVIGESK